MLVRFILLVNILLAVFANIDSHRRTGHQYKRSNPANGTIYLEVGKEATLPELNDEDGDINEAPKTDTQPEDMDPEMADKQPHNEKTGDIKNTYEVGQPPKYPLKVQSAETSAHDNEIGGCRDHPRAGLVCEKCNQGNKCFAAEHEAYTYSYCRRSCRHCDASTSSFHTYWRLRALSDFEPTWMLHQVEFYADPREKISLVDDPEKAYASSVYTGYKPSYAFDNNNSTAWYPSGWGNHDNSDDWIAYQFTVAVRVHGVRMVVDKDHATAAPTKVVVEASDKMYGPFTKKWTIYNPNYQIDQVYKLAECDVLWRRLEDDNGQWCMRLIAKLETWESARKSCEIEGGDIATITSKEEQRFITDEIGLCSHTWIGLSHTNQGYFWNDGSNSTYRNWKPDLSYSDVQKQTLNCVAMDPDGIWFNFHCSNKFYFVCKKRLRPEEEPRPDLTDNGWPYPPEVPPLIFFAPNVTVPVINSRNLEPGIFPDANGKVAGEDEEGTIITVGDLFYEQTVEHLKEKGLKPSEEIEANDDQDETDFTQELNKIAINTSPSDNILNETMADEQNSTHQEAQKLKEEQEQKFEDMMAEEVNETQLQTGPAKPVPQHKETPVPPPPQEGKNTTNKDASYPEIVHGKAVAGSVHKNRTKLEKKIPKAAPKFGVQQHSQSLEKLPKPESQPFLEINPQKAAKIGNVKNRKKKLSLLSESNGKQDLQQANPIYQQPQVEAGQQQSNTMMLYYVPNSNGTYTLMRPIYPWGAYVGGYAPREDALASASSSATVAPLNSEEESGTDAESPDTKQVNTKGISSSFKNKGNVAGIDDNKNTSSHGRRKIKVVQPLESAAQGADYSMMAEKNSLKKSQDALRTMEQQNHGFFEQRHTDKRKMGTKQSHTAAHFGKSLFNVKRGEQRKQHISKKLNIINNSTNLPKINIYRGNNDGVVAARNVTTSPSVPLLNKEFEISGDDSGSGSGEQTEADDADIFPDTAKNVWFKS